MSFPNVYKAPLSLFSNHLVLNNFKQWKLISSINFVPLQSAFLSLFFLALSFLVSRNSLKSWKVHDLNKQGYDRKTSVSSVKWKFIVQTTKLKSCKERNTPSSGFVIPLKFDSHRKRMIIPQNVYIRRQACFRRDELIRQRSAFKRGRPNCVNDCL